MILNNIETKISNLFIPNSLKETLVYNLYRPPKPQGTKTNILIKICFRYMKVCDRFISEKKFKDANSTLQFIKQTTSQIMVFEEFYEWILLKVRLIVLKIKLISKEVEEKRDKRKECDPGMKKLIREKQIYLERVAKFCDEIKKNKYFSIMKTDCYSFIQVVFLYGVRATMAHKNIYKSMCLIRTTRQIIEGQIKQLSSFHNNESKKLFLIIESKCKVLLQIYAFDTILQFRNGQQHGLEEILNENWNRYGHIFQQAPNFSSQEQIKALISEVILKGNHHQYSEQSQNRSCMSLGSLESEVGMLQGPKQTQVTDQKIKESNNCIKIRIRPNENTLLISKPSSTKLQSDNRRKLKTKVKFADLQESSNSQIPSSKSLSSSKKDALDKLQENLNMPTFSKERGRFMSIQYHLIPENLKSSKTFKKIMETDNQESQSSFIERDSNAIDPSENLIQKQDVSIRRILNVRHHSQGSKNKQIVGNIGSKVSNDYNRTIFKIAQSNSLDKEKSLKIQSKGKQNQKSMNMKKKEFKINSKCKPISIYMPFCDKF